MVIWHVILKINRGNHLKSFVHQVVHVGSVVEEKAKKKNKQTKAQRQQLQLHVQQKPWTGVWEREAEKKNSRPLVISATSFADFFFAFSLLRPKPKHTEIKL